MGWVEAEEVAVVAVGRGRGGAVSLGMVGSGASPCEGLPGSSMMVLWGQLLACHTIYSQKQLLWF